MSRTTKAKELKDKPTKQVEDAFKEVRRLAESGGSEAIQDLYQDDGSILHVICRAGEEPYMKITDPPDEMPIDRSAP